MHSYGFGLIKKSELGIIFHTQSSSSFTTICNLHHKITNRTTDWIFVIISSSSSIFLFIIVMAVVIISSYNSFFYCVVYLLKVDIVPLWCSYDFFLFMLYRHVWCCLLWGTWLKYSFDIVHCSLVRWTLFPHFDATYLCLCEKLITVLTEL